MKLHPDDIVKKDTGQERRGAVRVDAYTDDRRMREVGL